MIIKQNKFLTEVLVVPIFGVYKDEEPNSTKYSLTHYIFLA